MESQLEGFEFVRQREPVTDGIDVWGTVFELEHAHHGNIAVVILGKREIYFIAQKVWSAITSQCFQRLCKSLPWQMAAIIELGGTNINY